MENEFVSQQEVNPNEVQNEAPSWSNMETPPETETNSDAETDKSNNETTVDTVNRQESPDNNMPNDADSPETPVQDNREQDIERARVMAEAEDPIRTEVKKDINLHKQEKSEILDEDILRYAKANEVAQIVAEKAAKNYDKEKLARKILNGEQLTEEEMNSLRAIKEIEKIREQDRRNEEVEKARKEALIDQEIENIVNDENHPYHEIFITNYRKYIQDNKYPYDYNMNALKSRMQTIQEGKVPPDENPITGKDISFVKEIESIKKGAKMFAYEAVKRYERIQKTLEKDDFFDKIMGENY